MLELFLGFVYKMGKMGGHEPHEIKETPVAHTEFGEDVI